MSRLHLRLTAAVFLSLLFHLLPFAASLIETSPAKPPAQPALQARLLPPPAAPAPSMPLELTQPQPNKPAPSPAKKHLALEKKSEPTIKTWQHEVRKQLIKQQEQGEFYPPEAIALGQQGETLVLLLVDEQGRVSAARVEQGSGFPILDQAALRAVRKLHSLPADTPREMVLPVRFRLR